MVDKNDIKSGEIQKVYKMNKNMKDISNDYEKIKQIN